MAAKLFGADLNDFKRSLFRKCEYEDPTVADCVRFYNEEGEAIFLLADGFEEQESEGMRLYELTSLTGEIEYVALLDEESMIWTVVGGQRRTRPAVAFRDSRSLS